MSAWFPQRIFIKFDTVNYHIIVIWCPHTSINSRSRLQFKVKCLWPMFWAQWISSEYHDGYHETLINCLYPWIGMHNLQPDPVSWSSSVKFVSLNWSGKLVLSQSSFVEISNFITCPRTSKWSKSTCPNKIYLPKNWHFFFLFLKENMLWVYSLVEWGATNEYPQPMFFLRNKKKTYIKIWIIFIARAMKSR